MRYWVYISDKVEGPFEEDKLVTLKGFTPDTLICAEDAAAGGNQEWVKASSIFEFDQVPVQQPAAQAAPAQADAVQNAPADNGVNELAALLLGKLDTLTSQITGMQAKLDGMQTQLDEAIQTAQQAHTAATAQANPEFVPPQDGAHNNTITLTRHNLVPETETDEEALITNTESLVSKAEDLVAAANKTEEQPLDMLGTVDLGSNAAVTEVALGSNAGEEVVVSSAMDSLYNARLVEQSQEEKESTFQDLLTPAQAKQLSEEAEALKTKTAELDSTLKAAEDANAQNAEKEAILAELTQAPKEDVLDQVIKEREAEKTNTLKAASAGSAVAAGMAEPASAGEEKQATPADKQPLDFNDDAPALTIAPDAKNPAVQEEVLPAEQMPADAPKAKNDEKDPNNATRTGMMMDIAKNAAANSPDMPSLEDAGKPAAQEDEEGEKEHTLQELVPGASSDAPDNVLITAADLKDAFAEHEAQADQTVEEMFGIGKTASVQPQPAQTAPEEMAIPSLDDIGRQTADQPLPVGNPNDLTEIELKEGSTYLISDFVPPAKANGNELPKELAGLKTGEVGSAKGQEDQVELTEMVASTNQTEKPLSAEENAPADVTVSQVILENTIKTKRGATLDIKTVPMVPEPAQSDRLQLEGLDDDINTQHDIKSADEKPAGKSKMVLGVLAAIVLAALIYGMLAFMNLIPAQFNVLSSDKTQQAQLAAQDARMNEMLSEDQPDNYGQPAQPELQQPAANPMDTVLEEVKNHPLMNGFTLKEFIEAKHPAAQNLITWDISTAVDPDNYSVLVKVPPENPQSFKISYRFNYNPVTKALDPTISDAKNLLDQANQGAGMPQQPQTAPAL